MVVSLDSMDDLLNTADVGFMLVGASRVCGAAYHGDYLPIGMASHNCARGYYTFGHEVGHIFGAEHDKANVREPHSNNYGYGWLIKPKGRSQDEGYRTNMA